MNFSFKIVTFPYNINEKNLKSELCTKFELATIEVISIPRVVRKVYWLQRHS